MALHHPLKVPSIYHIGLAVAFHLLGGQTGLETQGLGIFGASEIGLTASH